MDSFAALITEFGGPAKFAAAIGIEPGHAGVMKSRDSIPPSYWPQIVAAAEVHKKAVSYATLAQIAASKRRAPIPAGEEA